MIRQCLLTGIIEEVEDPMPMYTYVEKKTGAKVDVVRTVSEMDLLPQLDECEGKLTPEQYAEADWERLISGGISVNRGVNWSGSKGNW